MTLIRVVLFLAIGALVTLVRFGFPRSSWIGFLGVRLLVVELIDLMRASVKSFAIRGGVKATRELKETTAKINISKRVLQLKVVNNNVHGRRKRHEKMAGFSCIGL